MTRRFPARFRPQDISPHPDLVVPIRPMVDAYLNVRGYVGVVPMLIDTGSDYTVLNPRQADELMGTAYAELAAPGASAITASGIGGESRNLIESVEFGLLDEDGVPFRTTVPILIAQPASGPPGRDPRWFIPSLLGRDLLELFDFWISRRQNEAWLQLPD